MTIWLISATPVNLTNCHAVILWSTKELDGLLKKTHNRPNQRHIGFIIWAISARFHFLAYINHLSNGIKSQTPLMTPTSILPLHPWPQQKAYSTIYNLWSYGKGNGRFNLNPKNVRSWESIKKTQSSIATCYIIPSLGQLISPYIKVSPLVVISIVLPT